MSLLLLFYSQLFINVEFYHEEKYLLVVGSVGAAVLNVVLNYLMIPVFGYVVAGYTTLLSYGVFAVSNYLAVQYLARKRGFRVDYFDLKALTAIFAVFSILSFTAMALYTLPLIRYAIVAAVLLALVILHKQVIRFVQSVLKR